MLNNKFRTSLTRDEIIGMLLGWISGPDIASVPEESHLNAEEQDMLESLAYSVLEDRKQREDEAWEANSLCLESGQSRDVCRTSVEDFNLEDKKFKRLSDELDDEISKGANSMLRIDQRHSTPVHTCYTRKSFDEWLSRKPELSTLSLTFSKPRSRQRSRFDQQKEIILACIDELKLKPECLEREKPGHSGIKAEICEMVKIGKYPFGTDKVFDNVWQRMRREKIIRNPK